MKKLLLVARPGLARRAALWRSRPRRRRRRRAGRLCRTTASWLCLPGRDGRLRPAAADHRARARRLRRRSTRSAPPPTRRSTASTSIRPCRAIRASTATWSPGSRSRPRAAVQFARFAQRLPDLRADLPLRRRSAAIAAALARPGSGADLRTSPMATCCAAWRHYLAHHNKGRPFVLIGHSQGTIHLIRLLAARDRGPAGRGAHALGAAASASTSRCREGRVGRRQLPHDAALHPRRPDRLRRSPMSRSAPKRRRPRAPCSAAPPRRARRSPAPIPPRSAATPRRRSIPIGSPHSTACRPAIAWSSQGPPPAPFLRTAGPGLGRLRQSRPARLSRGDRERRSRRRPHRPDSGRRALAGVLGAGLGPPPGRHQPRPGRPHPRRSRRSATPSLRRRRR